MFGGGEKVRFLVNTGSLKIERMICVKRTAMVLALVMILTFGALVRAEVYPDLSGEELLVYITFHEEEGRRLLELFREKTGVSYSYLRMPTGETVARVMAEGSNPRADFILGGTAESHQALANAGLLEAYVPMFADDIPAHYKSAEGYWTGFYVGPISILINRTRWDAEFSHLEKPKTFDDLLNPAFRGEIIMPNPSISGTGYTFLASMIQLKGEDEAFEYFKELSKNVAQFTSSGFTPAQRTAMGEYLIAVNFLHDQLLVKKAGFNVESIVPENAGWEIGANSIINGGPNPRAAKAFADFLSSREAGQLHTDLTERISTRSDVVLPSGVVPLNEMPINTEYSFFEASQKMKEYQARWEDELGY